MMSEGAAERPRPFPYYIILIVLPMPQKTHDVFTDRLEVSPKTSSHLPLAWSLNSTPAASEGRKFIARTGRQVAGRRLDELLLKAEDLAFELSDVESSEDITQ